MRRYTLTTWSDQFLDALRRQRFQTASTPRSLQTKEVSDIQNATLEHA